MLLDTLGTSLLGNLLTGKRTIRKFLMPPRFITNFEKQEYYEN